MAQEVHIKGEYMKILHIGISEHLGGIETYLNKIAHNIDRDKYQFDFLTYPDVTPYFYDELIEIGCRFQRVTPRKDGMLEFRKEFDSLLKREKYDIVHCHLNSLSFTEPINIALKNGIKVIVHSHNGSMIGRKLSVLLHKFHYVMLPRRKIEMLAVSDVAGKWMFGKKSQFTVLNNGVDLKKIQFSLEGRDKIRKELSLSSERLIVHTGAFRKQKNHEFLIDIFYELSKVEHDAKLMLVGDGELKSAIQNKVNKLGLGQNVVFAGIRNDISDILSAGDVFLFPSFYEGFPCALIEAEATGLYCFASDTITPEVKLPGICEFIGLQKDAAFWAEKIHNRAIQYNRLGGAKLVKEAKLDVDSDIERLSSIYDQQFIAR